MTAPSPPLGRVVTFYSYKGGTGRSMSLANAAFMLAASGQRVLAIDWDLEAPGLQRYFQPYLRDPALEASDGLIDFIIGFADAAARTTPAAAPDERWFESRADLRMVAYAVNWDGFEKSGGHLDFVPAGRQDAGYSMRVNSFNWQHFYAKLGGGVFLEAVKQGLRRNYDYVLIDSRTGVSDTSGVCTVQMPDTLVVCFTLNEQSIHGAAGTAASAFQQRLAPSSGQSTLRVMPVPTRVDNSEKERVDAARAVARGEFDRFLTWLDDDQLDAYWGDVETPHIAFYSLEEVLAVFDRPRVRTSLLPSVEGLVSWISEQRITEFPPLDERRRLQEQGRFLRRPRAAEPAPADETLLYVSCARADLDDNLRQFLSMLREELGALTGADEHRVLFVDDASIEVGASWQAALAAAVRGAKAVLSIVSPRWVRSEQAQSESAMAGALGKPVLLLEWIPVDVPVEASGGEPLRRASGDGGYRNATRDRAQWKDIYELAREISGRLTAGVSNPASAEPAIASAQPVLVTILAERSAVMRKLSKAENYGLRRRDWRPFPAEGEATAGSLVEEVAADHGIAVELVSPNRFRQWLSDARDSRIALIVIDALTAELPEYERQLLEWDANLAKRAHAIVCAPDRASESTYVERYAARTTGSHVVRIVAQEASLRVALADELERLKQAASGSEARQLQLALDFAESIELPEPGAGRRGGPTRIRSELDAGRASAVVVGSEVLRFGEGVDESFRQYLINGTLLAQLVADRQVPGRQPILQWYDAYFDVLRNIGCVMQERNFAQYQGGGDGVDLRQAVDSVLAAVVGPRSPELEAVARTLDTVQSPDADSPWATLFSRASQHANVAAFQVSVVELGPDGVPVVHLSAFSLEATSRITQVLFFKSRQGDATLRHVSGTLTVDGRVAEALRDTLRAKVAAHAIDHVRALPAS